MEQTLMTKLLDGQEKMIGELATVREIVRRHDEITFPEMKVSMKEISDTVTRIDSKHNKDFILLEKTREKERAEMLAKGESVERRLNILEDIQDKKDKTQEKIKSKFWGILWGGIEKVTYIVIGYIITKIKYFQ